MPEARFSFIFAPELFDRLRWFGQLRWGAVAGLAVAGVVGPFLGAEGAQPALFFVAGFVALYNLYFRWRLRVRTERLYANLRACAIRQMVADLVALGVTAHFTGGLKSPVLVFFAFHMAIGTVMISTRLMYLLAGATSAGLTLLYLAESQGLLTYHPFGGDAHCGVQCLINLLTHVVALFVIVTLTDSVMRRFKAHAIRLHETTTALSEKTEELALSLREKEELEQRKSHYMKISAHQLRSPLGTIKTTLDVLHGGLVDPTTERGRRLLGGAMERADDLLEIVNDLLELAKVREGRLKAPWTRGVNLNQLLADIFDSATTKAEEKEIALEPDFAGVATLDWGIPPDLVYAFENLVTNALKYSNKGQSVRVSLRTNESHAEIRIEDEGIGIPADLLDKIFLEFVRAPNAKRHAPEGTGLGLSIAREVCRAHGGSLRAESEEGKGSAFIVTLPLRWTAPEVSKLLPIGNEPGYRLDTPAQRRSRPSGKS